MNYNDVNFGTYTRYSDVPNGWMTKTAGTQGDPYASERELVDLLVTESFNKNGITMTYHIVTFNISADPLFGEDNNRTIERKFDVMGWYQLPREEKLWAKFGIVGMDQFSVLVSKRHFKVASQFDFAVNDPIGYGEYIPKIGDIMLAQYNGYLYEIVDIKEETGMQLLSKQHIWEFIVKPYKDEHLSLSASTSATIGYIAPYVNKGWF